jgi:hypothetical protein
MHDDAGADDWIDAEHEMHDLLESTEGSPAGLAERIIDKLSSFGISEATVATCDRGERVMGGLNVLGIALTDVRCQDALFTYTTKLVVRAGYHLRIGFIVAFFEPHLRDPIDTSDKGFMQYMRWFLSLRNSPATQWVIERAYLEDEGGEKRLNDDIETVGKCSDGR